MRKTIMDAVKADAAPNGQAWLNLEALAEVEISSEEATHPIEAALLPGGSGGWRAAAPGEQTIRLRFATPQKLRRIWLRFLENEVRRSQEYVLRWSEDGGQSWREIVRQQWNFSPSGASEEVEDHTVDLTGVTALELIIKPEMSGGALASLDQMRLA